MRYRRLGDTDLMVSEVGLDARALRRSDPETAAATLRAAIALGITVVAWEVSDALEDLEPLLTEAAALERGRLTLVALLDHVPAPEAMGPQAEAIASRLGSELDVLALPGVVDAAQRDALTEVQSRGIARLAGTYDGAGIEVLAGRIAFAAEPAEVPARLAQPGVGCVLLPVATPGELRAAIQAP